MFRQIISLITLSALLINTIGLTGCSKFTRLSVEEATASESCQILHADESASGTIIAVHTREKTYKFKHNFACIDTTTQTIEGYTKDQQLVSIPLTQVTSIETKSTDWTKTILLVSAICIVAAAVGIASTPAEETVIK